MKRQNVVVKANVDRQLEQVSRRLHQTVRRAKSSDLVELVTQKLNEAANALGQAKEWRARGESDPAVMGHVKRAERAIEAADDLLR